MRTSQSQSASTPSVPATEDVSAMRIDAPHSMVGNDAHEARLETGETTEAAQQEAAESLAVVEVTLADERESLRLQAEQLAGHLRSKQQELDRREAETNARIAKLENELRASRLWLREKVQQINEQQQELERLRRQADDHRESEHAAAHAAEIQQLRHVTADLQHQLAETEQRNHALEQELATLKRECDEAEQRIESAAGDAAAKVAEGQQRIVEIERLLEQHFSDLEAARQQFESDRHAAQQQINAELDAFEQRRSQFEAESARRRASLDERGGRLEQREGALENLHAEVSQLHRDSLEMRLITEQLWSQLAHRAAPAELARSIAELRSRLAKQFKVETDTLAKKQDQLAQLAERLDKRQQSLSGERDELLVWHTRRQQEIEEQAARLVAREQELDAQEDAMRQQRDAWTTQRREMQAELRRLIARPLDRDLAAA